MVSPLSALLASNLRHNAPTLHLFEEIHWIAKDFFNVPIRNTDFFCKQKQAGMVIYIRVCKDH